MSDLEFLDGERLPAPWSSGSGLLFCLLTTISLAAAVNPGQALLLGNIMSVYTAPNVVARGNFISLMFFVMSLGILVIYFAMGWSTNTIAQVRDRETVPFPVLASRY